MAARKDPPDALDCIEKRDLLAQENAAQDLLLAHAESFLAQDALDDALAFFDRAGSAEGIARVKAKAIEAGNAYLLFRILDSRHGRVEERDWIAVAERAEALDKTAYAVQAWRQAGRQEKVQELREKLPITHEPLPEDEKKKEKK